MDSSTNHKYLLFSGFFVIVFVVLGIYAAKDTSLDSLTMVDGSLAASINANAGKGGGKPKPSQTPATSTTPAPSVTPINSSTPSPTPSQTMPPITNNTYYVSPNGSDTNNGSEIAPFKSINKALSSVSAGGAVVLRGGEYVQRVTGASLKAGIATAPIRFEAYPDEKPVIKGLLWLSNPTYWNISGINVVWDDATGVSTEHMVKFSGGSNWTYTNAEVGNAKSFAGILVSGGASNWSMNNLYVHDTLTSNDVNQDHLIYVSNANNGLIERSLFVNSPNGRGIKLGPPSATSAGPNAITIRYNTFYGNLGPANVQLSYGTSNSIIFRNIFQKSGSGQANVTGNSITGTNNLVYENVGWESAGVVESTTNLTDKGGNIFADPQFTSLPNRDFHPLNPEVQAYGKYAQ